MPEPDGTEPVEGVDTKDCVFFEKPTLILVGKAEEPEVITPLVTPVNGHLITDEQARSLISPVRLHSSRQFQMCNNPPKQVHYPLTMFPTNSEAQEYLRIAAIAGFDTGAIVTRRWQNPWRYKNVHQWGVILYTIGHPPYQQRWSPFEVKWFEAATQSEKAWAEDLVVVHATLSEALLDDVLESQGIAKRG